MTYEQIIGDLQNQTYHPIYFLFGDEPYYVDLISNHIASNVLSEAEKSYIPETEFKKIFMFWVSFNKFT